jgi:hypothetical protein
MKNVGKNWLHLYVDAVSERDPYQRLSLVRELTRIPRQDEAEELVDRVIDHRSIPLPPKRARKTKTPPRR